MIVLIPAYEPDHRLLDLVTPLLAHATGVVVVDDGSGPAYRWVFDEARRRGCVVINHPVNRGKGHALKSGFRYLAGIGGGEDVVCADSDGQHRLVDVLAAAERVRATGHAVLGVRQFTGRVPLRSRIGNTTSRLLFALAGGGHIQDVQTGLRGYPASLLTWLESVPGNRFEYEMNVLLHAARCGHEVEELAIATIYLDQNQSSHFRPLADSVRVLAPLLRFSASSLFASGVDLLILLGVHAWTGSLLAALITAGTVSSTVNFVINRRHVFAGQPARSWASAATRYWGLVATLLAAKYFLLDLLTGQGVALLPAKVATDLGLFLASYLIQRRFVFARRAASAENMPAAQNWYRERTGQPG